MRIGIFGGTFDPIHFGHLSLAESAREELKLDKVIFVPAWLSPHKDPSTVTPANHRIKMLKLAIKDNKYFELDMFEINSRKIVYTYQTIQHFKKVYSNDELFFIIGSDSLIEMSNWKKGYDLLNMCKFAVGERPGFTEIPYHTLSKIITFKHPLLNISAKGLKERCRENRSIKYLVPTEVEKYILKNNLYR